MTFKAKQEVMHGVRISSWLETYIWRKTLKYHPILGNRTQCLKNIFTLLSYYELICKVPLVYQSKANSITIKYKLNLTQEQVI